MYDLFNPFPENIKTAADIAVVEDGGNVVPGLSYVPNYITLNEEAFFIRQINSGIWLQDIKRRVQHYGYKYDYKARNIDYTMYLGKLPDWIEAVSKRLHQECYIDTKPDQVIVNEYIPGQGIANHVDCEPCFGEVIISISLGSSCIMDFINLQTMEKVEVFLEPRSMVAISGAARHTWTHGIPKRKFDNYNGVKVMRRTRLSMTFRNVILV